MADQDDDRGFLARALIVMDQGNWTVFKGGIDRNTQRIANVKMAMGLIDSDPSWFAKVTGKHGAQVAGARMAYEAAEEAADKKK